MRLKYMGLGVLLALLGVGGYVFYVEFRTMQSNLNQVIQYIVALEQAKNNKLEVPDATQGSRDKNPSK